MKKALMAVGLVLLMAGTAQAGPIGGVIWNGGLFTVELTGVVGSNYTFVYTADFTGFTGGGHTDYIWGVNFKPSSGTVNGYSAVGDTAPGDWSPSLNNLDASGCTGGSSSFYCGGTAIPGAPTSGVPMPIYTWTFTLDITGAGTPDSLVAGAPIRALFGAYNPSNGEWQSTLMSETTTPMTQVPEPGALVLLGAGLVGLAFKLRRAR